MTTPYDAYTDDSDVVASAILTLLKASPTTLQVNDTTRAFYYGEQDLLPTTPAYCVTPGPEDSAYNGIGGRPVMITFTTYVMVYVDVVRDVQANLQQATQLATKVKHVVHASKTLGGVVLDCYCVGIEPGYAVKKGTLMAACRMNFKSKAKKILNLT